MAKPGHSPVRLRTLWRVVMVFGLLWSSFSANTAWGHAAPASKPDAARVLQLITWISGETPFQTTRIYDRQGVLLADIDDLGRRSIVGLDEIPDFLIRATIATEDQRFYWHNGLDYRAIARAAWQNSQSETIVSGGSTITQQLARILFMPPSERYQQTMERKFKEAQLAISLERYYSKDEILAMYLNMAYYGHRAYGVAAAAEVYFDKPLQALSPAECALLAGLPQAPVQYDPLLHPQSALQRQQVVLQRMVETGSLDAGKAEQLRAQKVVFHPHQRPVNLAPHFVEYIKAILIERFGTRGVHEGYQVHTSLDLRYQNMAERIARAQVMAMGEKHHFNNAAVAMLRPDTGGILAMVGSVDFNDDRIDGQVNMTLEPRQPGSSIKPILYAAAFQRGWSPASVIWDLPVSYKLSGRQRYVPTNITRRYYGVLRLRAALSNSLNVPAVKLLNQIGIPAMLETAEALGIRAWRQPASTYGLSLAVGGYEVPLLELTSAFATIANQGQHIPVHPILWLKDGAGQEVYRAAPATEQRPAISPVAAYQLASVLSDARTRKMMFPHPSPLDTSQITAAKTGTTDGWRDNLTVGFTSYLAVGVWTGNSNSKPMRNAIGVYTAGPIWHDIMESVWAHPQWHNALGYESSALPQGFALPENVVTRPVCVWMPGKFTPNCPKMQEEVFAIDAPSLPPASRERGYCLPAGASDAQAETYFLALPEDAHEATQARDWMRRRFGRTVQDLASCDTAPRNKKLVQPLALLPPRQLVDTALLEARDLAAQGAVP